MTFLTAAKVSTLLGDMNRLRSAVAGYDLSAVVAAHRVARRWWACENAANCCRVGQFGTATPERVMRDFNALDHAVSQGDFDEILKAWSNCERWVSCLDASTPPCKMKQKEAA
ncbi:hypothetical protein [Epibacterium ulvae]|uniref:hypothetical protein n=1 Tax=Epibacterium ulvae TaxID=1156985 RepID=UPI00249272E1|nr:hypothetical protein [Epibacterium ulvae]